MESGGIEQGGRRWCSMGGVEISGGGGGKGRLWRKQLWIKWSYFIYARIKSINFSIERTSNYFRHAFVIPACLQHVAWAVTRTHQQNINLSFTFFVGFVHLIKFEKARTVVGNTTLSTWTIRLVSNTCVQASVGLMKLLRRIFADVRD